MLHPQRGSGNRAQRWRWIGEAFYDRFWVQAVRDIVTGRTARGSAAPPSILLGLGVFLACSAGASADTVHLKDGRTIEGRVIKRDAAQVAIEVPGGEASVPAADVDTIRYTGTRLLAAPTPVDMTPSLEGPVQVDLQLVQRMRMRLRTLHRFFKQMAQVAIHMSRGETQAAALQIHRACQWILPTTRDGRFDPISALADLIILLGLRTPLLWIALAVIGEQRAFTRLPYLMPMW